MDQDLTQLIERVGSGDEAARAELVEHVYGRLRAMASRQLGPDQAGRTLHPTALVHEAWARLFVGQDPAWEGRHHFFGAAANAMRQAAVEQARRRNAEKRGAGWRRLTLSGLPLEQEGEEVDAIELDAALTELAGLNPRQARIVELRFFAGMTIPQTATVLGVSPRTVELDWRTARAWLRARLTTHETHATHETHKTGDGDG